MTRYQRTAERMNALVDREAVRNDPMYKMTVSLFSSWMTAVELALDDEHVDQVTAQRVLNRLVYATPAGAEAHLRIAEFQTAIRTVMETPPSSRYGTVDFY